ncbi:MAG TPA: hypothetical protein VN081_05915 [Dongiaceae bacterium]|nr:hypothetical protein [Dongiaceae bacterium]
MEEQFRRIINLHYGDFLIEKAGPVSSDWNLLASVVDLCNDGDMNGIKLAFDRIDGLLETPVKFDVPKFYVRYLNAKERLELPSGDDSGDPTEEKSLMSEAQAQEELETMGLRKVLDTMRKMNAKLPYAIKLQAEELEKRHHRGEDVSGQGQLVKTVIVAGLLRMAQNSNSRAISMVFDQIDGKLMHVIKLLNGEDMYVNNVIDDVAPANAVKMEYDGEQVWVAENKAMEMMWIAGFAKMNKGMEGLVDEEYRN